MGLPNVALVLAIASVICLTIPNLFLADDSPSDYLKPHNDVRKNAKVDPLDWNKELARSAEQSAGNCGKGSYDGRYGVNVYKGRGATAFDAVKEWTKCKQGGCSSDYEQVVWPRTKSLGCARHHCQDRQGDYYFIVRYYDPPASKH
uniref:Pathogenesis-related protein PRMS n=1 Tax=Elaeis guineensis var. tenera TaxID=51953 RepID=A0A6I9SHM9_ELAGV|nr:pathogenesis-related protein PRMS [Elaeis guineensis]